MIAAFRFNPFAARYVHNVKMRTTVVINSIHFFRKKRFTARQIDHFGDSVFAVIGLAIAAGVAALLGYTLWNFL